MFGFNLGQVLWLIVSATTATFLIISAVSYLHKPEREHKLKTMLTRMTVAVLVLFAAGCATFPHGVHPGAMPNATSSAAGGGGPVFHLRSQSTSANPLGTTTNLSLNQHNVTKRVVFSFDDGPDVFTPSIVSELKALHVKAEFFVIGKKAQESPGTIRDEVAAGDVVGDHTWDHKSLTGKGTGTAPLSPSQVRDELLRTAQAIHGAGAPRPTIWRPPYGAVSPADARIASSLGMRLVMDSSFNNTITDSEDWSGHSPAAIAKLVELHINSGTKIFAFHDGINTAPNTVEALPLIVAWMNQHHVGSTLNLPSNTTGGWLTPHGQAHQNAKGTGGSA